MPSNPIPALLPKAYYQGGVGLFQDTGGTTPATANGDPIGLWQDQSGNGYHLTQSTGGNRPTLATNRFKGLPAVNFDNTSSQFLNNASFPWTQSKTTGAWVIACQMDSACPASAFVSTTQDQLSILSLDRFVYAYLNSAATSYGTASLGTKQGTVLSLVYDGTGVNSSAKLKLYRNNHQLPVTWAAGESTVYSSTFPGGTDLFLGRQAAGGYLKGRIVEAAFFASLADADRIAVTDYLGATYFSQSKSLLIATGDSRTIGYPGDWNQSLPLTGMDSWPLHCQSILGSSAWDVANVASGGTTWANRVNAATGDVDGLQDDWRPRCVVVAFSDVNDFLAGTATATIEATVAQFFADRATAGFLPADVFCGVAPWNSTTSPQSLITDLATWQRTPGNLSAGVRLIDFQADPRFNDLADTSDASLYSDGVHFTDAGNAALAGIAAAVIDPAPPFNPSWAAHSNQLLVGNGAY